eukprot:TRINITY_DN10938_c0_g1_i1.p1 TRINITY_DN10938_c0_g1~~TRINITY_DN10938_c0_g1_i1.p1  ORF type:complete len:649 (+),score=142.50 TRINITY_DN10938_c0_g1_i1:120-1949(+)
MTAASPDTLPPTLEAGAGSPASGAASAPRPPKPIQFESLDPSRPHFHFVEGEEVILGRGPPEHQEGVKGIALTGPDTKMVSVRHCRLFTIGSENTGDPADVFVQDLSSNGTFCGRPEKLAKIGKSNSRRLRPGCILSLLDPARGTGALSWRMAEDPDARGQAEKRWGKVAREYKMCQQLGTGNFATVRLGVHHKTGEQVAVKVVDKRKLLIDHDFSVERLLEEVRMLRRLSHPHVVSIKDYFDDSAGYLCIVLELVRGGDFLDYMVNSLKFTESESTTLFVQMLEALLYLHSKGIAHRDLKPENVLVDMRDGFKPGPVPAKQAGLSKLQLPVSQTILKLADFGLAKWTGERSVMLTYCGTPMYIAPEIQRGAGYTKLVDVWSMGIILFIMVTGVPPKNPHKRGWELPEAYFASLSGNLKDFVKRLLVPDPAGRICMADICAHPWLAGVKIEGSEKAERHPGAPGPAAAGAAAAADHSAPSTPGGKRGSEATTAADSVVPSAKRMRSASDTEPDADEPSAAAAARPQWQWKADLSAAAEEGWEAYDADISKKIEDAYQRHLLGKQRAVAVNKPYCVSLQNLFQWNSEDDKKQRPVRRVIVGEPRDDGGAN